MSGSVSYLHLPADTTPPSIEEYRPFAALLVIEQPCARAWEAFVSDWLVRSGCLYMMAWGLGCSSWDDSVDHANLSAFDYGLIPDDAFVMTTWHADQPLTDALWFAAHSVEHPTVPLERTIIIHISAEARQAEFLAAFQTAREED